MRRRQALTMIALLIVCSKAWGATGDVAGTANGLGELTFKLSPTKPAFTLYEPVIVMWRLSNPTSKAVEVENDLMLGVDVSLYVVDPTGTRSRVRPGVEYRIIPLKRVLSGGESLEWGTEILFDFGRRGLVFPTSGDYEIGGSMVVHGEGGKRTVEASEIRVQVKSPTGKDEAFLRRLGSPESWIHLYRTGIEGYCGGKPIPSCFEELRAMVRDYPTAAYSPFLQYNLAAALDSGRLDVTPREALRVDLLRGFLDQWPGHGLRFWVLPQLERACADSGDDDLASRYGSMFRKEYPAALQPVEPPR